MSKTCLLSPRWRDTAFSAGDRDYQWLDVFLAAMLRGDWHAFERRLVGGLACVVASNAEGTRPDDTRVEAEATAFRYARELLTTEETTAWLGRTGLDVEAWTEFLVRDLLRQDRAEHIDALIETHRDEIAITDAAFVAEGHCSDAFAGQAKILAGRAAVAASRGNIAPASIPPQQADIDRVLTSHSSWLEALDRAEMLSRLAHASHLESLFHAEAKGVVTDDALGSELARHQMEWMRIDLERLSFDDEQAAREALLCMREDGLSFDDVAQESHESVRSTRDLLERIDPEWHDVLLSASADEVLGPIAVGRCFEIAVLVAKRSASLDDPLVRTRAEQSVVEHLVSKAVLSHVREPAVRR